MLLMFVLLFGLALLQGCFFFWLLRQFKVLQRARLAHFEHQIQLEDSWKESEKMSLEASALYKEATVARLTSFQPSPSNLPN